MAFNPKAQKVNVAETPGADIWGPGNMPNMLVRIEGLIPVGDGMFEIENVKPRNIDWPTVMAAIGGGTDEYADAISEAIWDCDLRAILRERVKRA